MTRPCADFLPSNKLVDSRDMCASVPMTIHRYLLWAHRLAFFAWCLIGLSSLTGCKSDTYLNLRAAPWNPLAESLQLVSPRKSRPSPRTQQVLRKHALLETYQTDPIEVLTTLQHQLEQAPTADKAIAFAELSYLQGFQHDSVHEEEQALNWFAASVVASYQFLFHPRYDSLRNPYDPQFRRACELYNESLESSLRILNRSNRLNVGSTQLLNFGSELCRLRIIPKGNWRLEQLGRFEFTSDYEVRGMRNHHTTFGLGVPLIAVYQPSLSHPDPLDDSYPDGLSFPVTAFLRIHQMSKDSPTETPVVDLELLDPLTSTNVVVDGRRAPIQSDITTPIGYTLDSPTLKKSEHLPTFGFVFPEAIDEFRGIYLLEAYDPTKIPVLMVHGLWSSPLTWIDMFNDLRSFSEIRSRYQFWFYLYPTAKPFWESAALLRRDIADLRSRLDPYHQNSRLDQMVMVGHSMGGLLSRMQVIDSGDRFWNSIAAGPFDRLRADSEARQAMAEVAFFRANPAIRRIITLATPHRGSHIANDWTQLLARKLIRLPEPLVLWKNSLARNNPGLFHSSRFVESVTSIDSLHPDNPFFKALDSTSTAPWVQHHNVVAVNEENKRWWLLHEPSDGIVPVSSAEFKSAKSEISVNSDHQYVHREPLAILEVRRILLEHLTQASIPARAARYGRFEPVQSEWPSSRQSYSHSPPTSSPRTIRR